MFPNYNRPEFWMSLFSVGLYFAGSMLKPVLICATWCVCWIFHTLKLFYLWLEPLCLKSGCFLIIRYWWFSVIFLLWGFFKFGVIYIEFSCFCCFPKTYICVEDFLCVVDHLFISRWKFPTLMTMFSIILMSSPIFENIFLSPRLLRSECDGASFVLSLTNVNPND